MPVVGGIVRSALLKLIPIAFLSMPGLAPCAGAVPSEGKRFTVADEIEMLSMQGSPEFSPDGKHFYVVTQRGLLKENVPEYTLWVWATDEVFRFLSEEVKVPPQPIPLARIAAYKDGPMNGMHFEWLADSSAVAYAALTDQGTFRLFRADLNTRTIQALTPESENVTGYSFTGEDYVYTITSPQIVRHFEEESTRQAVTVTGRSLYDILESIATNPAKLQMYGYSELWAVIGGKRFRVENVSSKVPVHLYVYATRYGTEAPFKLSPDRRSLVALLPPRQLPREWAEYQAPTGYSENARAVFPESMFGREQDVVQPFEINERLITSYHLIDLASGATTPIVNGPAGRPFLDWNADLLSARWSVDGDRLLLSNTFLPLDGVDDRERARRTRSPCLAVYEIKSGKISCVFALIAGLDTKRFGLEDVRFDSSDRHRVIVDFTPWRALPDGNESAVYRQRKDSSWSAEKGAVDPLLSRRSFDLRVQQSANDPPKLAAVDRATKTIRVFWDPNPQLAGMEWGEGRLIRWRDKTGADYEANLLMPPGYVTGTRYPLVIQTHGSMGADVFVASGLTTTGFAAREMSGAGMIVAQMSWNARRMGLVGEGDDNVEGFASLIEKLDREGLIDPANVGLIGWSRSVYHTYSALAAGRPRLAAASVIEGVNYGYWQFMMGVDESIRAPGSFPDQLSVQLGAAPFGDGLQTWIKRSPVFNLDKVSAPLLMLETGTSMAVQDWEPYAALYYRRKPVDMILLKAGMHIQSNPQQRLATQGITVDWYRFWLQGYEDPDPTKLDQYRRWEGLCDMQIAANPGSPAACTRHPLATPAAGH